MVMFGPPGPRDWESRPKKTLPWWGIILIVLGGIYALGTLSSIVSSRTPSAATTTPYSSSWLEDQVVNGTNLFGGPAGVAEAHCQPVTVNKEGIGTYTCQVRSLNSPIWSTDNVEIGANGQWAAEPASEPTSKAGDLTT
jgi:hypothetical protein